ncbi:rab-GTPase-TBC domain-domain-containing protein [Absidia repens]|uniref:Rab-GTPase-TBC domain-domain-containing protein n=1 Tax=Absidia repens TaxID=90262 RepID=A0A1X2INR3_9FUNG|nr:rab-GTPase-TBC domain-domain-containing protein [Absidia repens]
MARKRKNKKHAPTVSPGQKKRQKAQRKKAEQTQEGAYLEEKMAQLLEAIETEDLSRIKELGRQPNGFLTDSLRRRVWPLLLECPGWNRHTKKYNEKHKDEQQVSLDVPRSLSTYPKGLTDKRRKKLQQQLNYVIIQVLRKYPRLNYYQGFHDICTIFLLLYENQVAASQLVGRVALLYIRDAMLETLEPILRELGLLDTLLYLQDPELGSFLQETGVLPYYCLSWVITWFSHDLEDVGAIFQLFDIFLCSTPMMPLYTSAALVLIHRDIILTDFSSDDPSELHSYLSKLPQQQNLNINIVIELAVELETKWDPLLVQKQADVALDQVSVINTYHQQQQQQQQRAAITGRQKVVPDSGKNSMSGMKYSPGNIEQRMIEAYDIVSLSPLDRKPIDLAMVSSPTKKHKILIPQSLRATVSSPWSIFMVSAIGIGAAAILVANQSQLLSSWPLS